MFKVVFVQFISYHKSIHNGERRLKSVVRNWWSYRKNTFGCVFVNWL